MEKKIKNLRAKGFGLVEIIIGATIISVALAGLVVTMRISLRAAYDNLSKTQANFILMEGMEAVRAMRDTSWSANIAPLTVATDYYLYWSGTNWATTTSQQVIDGTFYRKFVLEDAYRDGSDNIAGSGTLDSGTKKVTLSVAWRAGQSTTTLQTTTYISNIFSN